MPDFLTTAFQGDQHLIWQEVLIRQILALVFGVIIALIYRWARKGNGAEKQSIPTTLILLTVMICAISAVIGDNVARAFSLVGALSIVRFRTVVEDTRDTAFVILAVGTGMALGSGHLFIPLLLIPIATVGTLFFRNYGPPAKKVRLTIRTGLGVDQGLIEQAMALLTTSVQPTTLSTTRQGAAIELGYDVQLRYPATARQLLDALHQVEGIMGVELETI